MANEVLTRTPSSTGNRKKFTWAGWIKRNHIYGGSGNYYSGIFSVGVTDGGEDTFMFSDDKIRLRCEAGTDIMTSEKYGDPGNWTHVMMVVDTTLYDPDHRCIFYINGVKNNEMGAEGDISQNANLRFNSIDKHYLGEFPRISNHLDGQFTDVFFVDGQALTPDVFGFFKDGKGYQSSGTTQATDFRSGQWSPKAPRTIKSEINRRGGFGVNGFYLPMNDSSNFGADFHCAPNSIIKLKGEDLPQPRNGLPTTSDNYVSQLRSDPYAANLVLAVPGVNTQPTGSELITNGTFDTNVSGWTVTDTGSIVRQSDGTAEVTRGSSAEVVYQTINTVVGTTYELSVDITAIAGSHGQIYVRSTYDGGSLDAKIGYSFYPGTFKGTFTADTTQTRIILYAHPSGSTSYDNISVKETTISEYSADIKGSGTNKTFTPVANAGIRSPHGDNGFQVHGYYGSALHLDSAGDDCLVVDQSADFNLGDEDYTIEGWYYDNETAVNSGNRCYWAIGGVNSDGTLALFREGSYLMLRGKDVGQAYENIIYVTNHGTPVQQWNHLCVERVSGRTTLYLNGVALQTTTDTTTIAQGQFTIGAFDSGGGYAFNGWAQDVRVYKGVAKYKGGFDVPKHYNPTRELEPWRQVSDTCKNNFATLNPNILSNPGLTDGNLKIVGAGGWIGWFSTFSFVSGKYYMEMHFPDTTNTNSYYHGFGLKHDGFASNASGEYFGNATGKAAALVKPGSIALYNNGNQGDIATGTYTGSHIMGMAIDADSGKVWWSMDGTWIGANPSTGNSASYTFTAGQTVIPGVTSYQSSVSGDLLTLNFGQNPTFSGTVTAGTYTDGNGKGLFKYQPPSGFLALCEDNLPTPAIADPGKHFKSVLWTGINDTVKVKCGFQPDFVWIKNRDYVNWHALHDSIRGPYLELNSNEPSADRDRSSNDGLRSFDSDGFTSGLDDNTGGRPGDKYVAWCWKAGGSAVPNTSGSVTSQVSVNQDAGFSIVSWTSDGTSLTVGHGLNKVPAFILQKQRDASANWTVYHKDLAATEIVKLDTNGDKETSSDFANTSPTSSVLSSFTTGISGNKVIAYCWAEIEGYSKFGSYTGNGNADGPFVYCGFKPAWVMVKNIDDTGGRDWGIQDNSRASSNPCNKQLKANQSEVENSGLAASTFQIDMLSNGFKVRNNTGIWNNNGDTIIFAAFAESPFQTANAK